MNIAAVTACTIGVAHTYIAKEKLIEAAQNRGHTIHVETQGNIGIEEELSPQAIQNADVIILAADISVAKQERFAGKPIVRVSSAVAIKQPENLIVTIEHKLSQGCAS
ncbi:fructose PTS transporter subunit IIB [uncultured Dubosiella sp.]|uniref:PTS fructose transporter subunit IIB n=1 Tax=uncultured Dubosiella sp. TaxID=1937011 RepID=UPI0025888BC1|nr:fructose PTS transporter subunit IIB [uncultured Dubosiella sp.]